MDYDLAIIGAGQAAVPLAKAFVEAGRTAVIVEREHLGGSCVNYGCTPTKAAFASARLAYQARRATEYGLSVPKISVDFEAVIRRARSFAESGRNALAEVFEGNDGPRLMRGNARLLGKCASGFRIAVDRKEITAAQVVLDTGTTSVLPPIEGLDRVHPITAENWLDRTQLPKHLAIIGGGYIGLEMAQFYRRMGSAVTVIEGGERIASREDTDISECLRSILEDEGIAFCMNARVERVAAPGGAVCLTLNKKEGSEVLTASDLFVATGRRPNTSELGLDSVGVALDEQGFVQIDERLATSCSGVWAAGDIRGGAMFTHTSWDDNRILRSQMLGDGDRTTRRVEPYAIFVDPQLGRVGMTEAEAREKGRHVKVARLAMSSNGKAREIGEERGMIKVVADAGDGCILGAAVLAHEGAELVHCYIDVIQSGASYRTIRDTVHIHPTIAEAVQSVVAKLDG